MKKLTAFLLLFTMILSIGASFASVSELEDKLDAQDSVIEGIKQDIDGVKEQQYAVERKLEDVFYRVEQVKREIEENKLLITQKEEELEKIRLELEKIKQELAEQEEAYGDRLRVMYYKKDESFWNVLFESKNIADLLNRLDQLKAISEQDKQLLIELNEKRQAIEELEEQEKENYAKLLELKAQLARDEQELIDLQEELERRKEEILAERRKFEAELEAQNSARASIASNLANARAEAERIAQERADEAASSGGTSRGEGDITIGGWTWPTSATYVTSTFGPRTHPVYGGSSFHYGIDIAGPAGTPIYASRGGLVILAGWNGGYGNCVVLDHGDGTQSLYAHASGYNVSKGDYVSQGDVILYMGTTGTSTGNHLHFEILINGSAVDPGPYIGY
jgi:murein DD-endopeptidase MepM/ murein hydrolase activator NlpD